MTSEGTGLSRVLHWILDHACKYRMKKVISALMKYENRGLDLKCVPCGKNFPSVNPNYLVNLLFSGLLETINSLLEKTLTFEDIFTLDTETLALCAELLDTIYLQEHFIQFAMFYKLHHTLRLLSLILQVAKGEQNQNIMAQYKKLFPSSAPDQMQRTISQYNITEEVAKCHLDKEKKSRLFILQLVTHKDKREHYLEKRFLSEFRACLESCKKVLPDVIQKALVPHLPETYIDKIISGTANAELADTDPAVQILLEVLQGEVGEEDLMDVLKELDPSVPVPIVVVDDEILLPLETDVDLETNSTSKSPPITEAATSSEKDNDVLVKQRSRLPRRFKVSTTPPTRLPTRRSKVSTKPPMTNADSSSKRNKPQMPSQSARCRPSPDAKEVVVVEDIVAVEEGHLDPVCLNRLPTRRSKVSTKPPMTNADSSSKRNKPQMPSQSASCRPSPDAKEVVVVEDIVAVEGGHLDPVCLNSETTAASGTSPGQTQMSVSDVGEETTVRSLTTAASKRQKKTVLDKHLSRSSKSPRRPDNPAISSSKLKEWSPVKLCEVKVHFKEYITRKDGVFDLFS